MCIYCLGPVVTDPDTHVGFYIKHRQDRENQVIDLLQAGPQSASSIVKVTFMSMSISCQGNNHIFVYITSMVTLIESRLYRYYDQLMCY